MVLGRQAEIRAESQQEAEVRRSVESGRRSRLAAFRFWRLHVMVWLEDARGAR
jgi:hypothetical protein